MRAGDGYGHQLLGAPRLRYGFCIVSLTADQQRALLEEILHGEPAERRRACRALIDDVRPAAMAVIWRAVAAAGLGSVHAEEAWQQALCNFFTVGAQRYRGEASVRSYFARCALHAAIDVVRDATRRRPLEEQHAVKPATPSCEAQLIEQRLETIEALRSCIDELPEDMALAVRLYYIEEQGSCASCAARVGISTAAFMKRLERARRRLRRCVARRAERAEDRDPEGSVR